MSTEAIHFVSTALPSTTEEASRIVSATNNSYNIINKLPFDALYQICFAPEPTPQQIAMEEFLLDCD